MTENVLQLVSEPMDGKPSLSVVERIATLEETDPIALPPLYDTIDPEALDSLVDSSTTGDSRPAAEIQFTYCGYDVLVERDGTIAISAA